MILALPRILVHFNILWYMLPKGISQERALEFTAELVSFIGGLANEGERTLVIGGAARIDVAIERLLRAVMQHHPGGNDNLFDPDRPLGTFSAKISLAYRLGLLDDGVEHALHMIRKIRNDFAHATTRVSLMESSHVSRVREIVKCAQKNSIYDKTYHQVVSMSPQRTALNDLVISFIVALVLIAVALEYAVWSSEPLKPAYVASFDF